MIDCSGPQPKNKESNIRRTGSYVDEDLAHMFVGPSTRRQGNAQCKPYDPNVQYMQHEPSYKSPTAANYIQRPRSQSAASQIQLSTSRPSSHIRGACLPCMCMDARAYLARVFVCVCVSVCLSALSVCQC